MPQITKKGTAVIGGTAAIVGILVGFTPNWEGMDKVAKRDMIGTGHPITYCYGQTDEFGKVKVGTRFTKAQCDVKLAESLPRYIKNTAPAVIVPIPVKSMAALVDAAYNAGPGAVKKSPMVRLFNAGKFREACDAFKGWYVTSAGQVRKGLIARRAGETIGDTRKSERALCLEGLNDTTSPLYLYSANEPIKVAPATPAPSEAPKPKPGKVARLWSWLMETS